MSKEMLTVVAALLTTLAECDGCPESTLYMAVGCNITICQQVIAVLLHSDLINVKGHWVTLTDKGKATAAKINAAMPAK